MRHLSRNAFLALACLLPVSVPAQQNHAADRLLTARALYYTPTAGGLKSFHCAVSMDWKDLLTRFGGKEIPDDNPDLVYLKTVQLSATDQLRGKGSLEWTETGSAPDSVKDEIGRLHDGLSQTLGGFFQTWNEFMNGGMVPAPDKTTIVSPAGDGIKLHASSPEYVVDEVFDKNLLLTDVHVVSKEMEVTMSPTYSDSPDGRIVSTLQASSHQPPTAPPTNVTMSITYAPVSSFQLPSSVKVDVKNVGGFLFNFSACKVETSDNAPDQP